MAVSTVPEVLFMRLCALRAVSARDAEKPASAPPSRLATPNQKKESIHSVRPTPNRTKVTKTLCVRFVIDEKFS